MPMLQIGAVAFSTIGPHYDKLASSAKATWARQKRFARADALQFTGMGEEAVTVSGTIYTDYFQGFSSLSTLRAQMPRPQMLVSGAGDVFGLWCIVGVSNEQTYQDQRGRPRKVTFDVKLERYGEDGVGGLGLAAFSSALSAIGGAGLAGLAAGFPGIDLSALAGGFGLDAGPQSVNVGLPGGAIGVDIGTAAGLSGAVSGAGAAAAEAAQQALSLW